MKIKKSDLLNMIQEQNDVIAKLIRQVNCHHKDIIRIEGVIEPEPQAKQLDQSVFNNMHERWKFAAIDADGRAHRFNKLVDVFRSEFVYEGDDYNEFKFSLIGTGYDTSNWQDSLIERDTAKELTGSDLARVMLARGDKYISGFGHHHSDKLALEAKFADTVSKHTQCFQSSQNAWDYFVPINNQGEPLTQAEAGL